MQDDWLFGWGRFAFAAKVPIVLGAIAGTLAGLVAADLLPKNYIAVSVMRTAAPADFVGISTILEGMPGDWHKIETVTATAQQTFLTQLRDRAQFESFVRSHRQLFGDENLDKSMYLDEMYHNRLGLNRSKDPTDDYIRLDFAYPEGTRGAEFLNEYVQSLISQTKDEFVSLATAAFTAAKEGRLTELARLRRIRDLSADQAVQDYKDALDTASAAGLEKPALVSLGSTSTVVTTNAPMPKYFYGTTILAREMQHAKAHIGNDLAIPDFPNLSASMDDIDRRMSAFKDRVISPMVVSETAVKTRPTLRRGPYVGAGLFGGVFFAVLWSMFFHPASRLLKFLRADP